MEDKRIVDLGRLAEALEHCLYCSMPIQLKSTIEETKYGLGSLLNIRCKNVDCMKVIVQELGGFYLCFVYQKVVWYHEKGLCL